MHSLAETEMQYRLLLIPVTDWSENKGLDPLSVVRRAERLKITMQDYFSLEEQRAISKKLILAISDQKKVVKKNKINWI